MIKYTKEDDELHDSICAHAREYLKNTPRKEINSYVFESARLQADTVVLRRKVKALLDTIQDQAATIERQAERIEELESDNEALHDYAHRLRDDISIAYRRDLEIANEKIDHLQKHLLKIAELKHIIKPPPVMAVKKEEHAPRGEKE